MKAPDDPVVRFAGDFSFGGAYVVASVLVHFFPSSWWVLVVLGVGYAVAGIVRYKTSKRQVGS